MPIPGAARPGMEEFTDVDVPRSPSDPAESVRFSRGIGAFVAIGILLRILPFAANPPLWGDEACLAFNFIDRGYLDLLRPLDYGQVAPPLFLWVERAVVGVFGFSEPSLRLFPLLCGVASVLLFRRLAGLALRGVPELLAMAIFAVSVHPIRHASDVKPYASDLLMALALLTPAFAWLRRRDRAAPLWALAGLAPIALLASYPAAFVAGGVGLGLAWPVWKSGRTSARLAFAAYGLAVVVTSALVFAVVAGAGTRPYAPGWTSTGRGRSRRRGPGRSRDGSSSRRPGACSRIPTAVATAAASRPSPSCSSRASSCSGGVGGPS